MAYKTRRFYTKHSQPVRQIPLLAAGLILGVSGTAMAITQSTDATKWLPTIFSNNVPAGPKPSKEAHIVGPPLDMSNTACALNSKKTPGLSSSTLPQLQKLQEYESACTGKVTDTMMMFTGMPNSAGEAISLSQRVAANLKEFARYSIRPVVILEPTASAGLVNFKEYRDGKYDAFMETYFQNLKVLGITDRMMGLWVPFPEPNIPVWDDTTVEDTVANITKTITLQKKYFPGSKAGILLDSMSYPSGKHSWDGGKYVSLTPYVASIPKGLVDSFGYQGFPWSPPQGEGGIGQANVTAGKFLQADLAIEAAKELGVNEVWLNTGSFGKSHANDPSQQVTASPGLRSEILQSIISEAKKVKAAGFTTGIHIFAEDKSAADEGVDWSYWQPGQANSSPDTPVFKALVANARDEGLNFWLFDVTH